MCASGFAAACCCCFRQRRVPCWLSPACCVCCEALGREVVGPGPRTGPDRKPPAERGRRPLPSAGSPAACRRRRRAAICCSAAVPAPAAAVVPVVGRVGMPLLLVGRVLTPLLRPERGPVVPAAAVPLPCCPAVAAARPGAGSMRPSSGVWYSAAAASSASASTGSSNAGGNGAAAGATGAGLGRPVTAALLRCSAWLSRTACFQPPCAGWAWAGRSCWLAGRCWPPAASPASDGCTG